MVPRANLTVTDKTVVCEKHFAPGLIIRVDSVTRADGSILNVPRKIPKLVPTAYPSVFPNVPSYLSEEPAIKRKAPESRRAEIDARDEQRFEKWICADKISCFDELSDKLGGYLEKDYSDWTVSRTDVYICLYRIDLVDVPRITVSLRIDRSMHVDAFKGEQQLDVSSLEGILGSDCVLMYWSQLSTLLSQFSAMVTPGSDLSISVTVACIQKLFDNLYRKLNDSDEYNTDASCQLRFLSEQFSLLFATRRRYSADMLMFAFRLLCVSRSAFGFIRDKALILPHASYLRKLSSVFSVTGELNEDGHVAYLRDKASILPEHERHVILMLDEIHVNPKITYKGGCFVGMASNSPIDEATNVQAFMICSLLSSNKDVAALIPVKSMNAAYLKECTFKVISMLENCGYLVICLISDNNRVNRNMFTALSDGELKPWIPHPCNSLRKLFFLFDSVHLLKCIRNNWLGQSDTENTFTFPDFTTGSICRASLSHVRQLYDSEKDSIVKMAPGLNRKALFPSNLERQNVKLALKIFDEKLIVALDHFGQHTGKDVSGTRSFVSIILKLWKILNVKSVDKGYRKRDTDSNPIHESSDGRVLFLNDVFNWLCKWESLNQKPREGRLSNETLVALKHTVSCFNQLIPYLLETLHLSYVLTGKFQTDCLEARFGKYRKMSGTNYHISVQEIRESEKKLKLMSLLHVVSAAHNKISLTDFITQCSDSVSPMSRDDIMKLDLIECLYMCDDIDVNDAQRNALIFIAGYVGFKMCSSKLHCDLCKWELITDHTLQLDMSPDHCQYLIDLDRGGLKWPTDLLVEAVTQMFSVFQAILSKEFEPKFLGLTNQKSVLLCLFNERLKTSGVLEGECVCGLDISELLKPASSIVANVFLNNYSKRACDRRAASKDMCKRKMSTLTKK